MRISIEYCTQWNYLPRAASMASALLEKYGNAVESLTLIPSGGGVYEVMKNDNLIFSKKAEERFPELDEIIESLEKPV